MKVMPHSHSEERISLLSPNVDGMGWSVGMREK